MRLSFLDPGSKRTGFAYGDGSRLPTVGAWGFPQAGVNYGQVLACLADALEAHIEQYRPDQLAYESPIVVFNQCYKDASGQIRKRNDNLATLRKTIPLGPRIEEVCWRRGIPCFETSIESVKKELSGAFRAEKSVMVEAATKLGVVLPSGPGAEDAADALGGWLLLLRLRDRAASVKFDQALYSARGTVLI